MLIGKKLPCLALCLMLCATVAAKDEVTDSVAAKYPKLSSEPFGKGVFAHIRAGGQIRGTESSIRELAGNPYIAGTQLSYTWSELEPTEGQYRWDIIEKDMGVRAQHGKKCWLEVSTAFRWDPSGKLGVPKWVCQKGVPKLQAPRRETTSSECCRPPWEDRASAQGAPFAQGSANPLSYSLPNHDFGGQNS